MSAHVTGWRLSPRVLTPWQSVGAALLTVLSLLCSPLAAAQAQSAKPPTAAAAVQVTGNGGDITAVGASVIIGGNASSIRAAGAMVDIEATVTGPVEAAGAEVIIAGDVGGDVRAGAGLVEVRGKVGGETYLGGAVVRFDGMASKSVQAAAATIEIGQNATIAGDLLAGGASMTVAGTIGGAANLSGAAIVFNGKADGTVTVSSDDLIVGPTARIGGDLVVVSRQQPVIADGAIIAGQVRLQEPTGWWALPAWLWALLGAAVVAAGAVLAGVILLLIGRSTFEDGLDNAAFRPISSGFIGLATLILLPIVAALLMATVIGLSFGLAFLLILPFLLVAGHAVVAACIGVWLFDRTGGPRSPGRLIVFMIAGAVVIAIVWLIPWVGPLLAFLAMLVGAGAYIRSLSERMRRVGSARV
jgi:cytoskeletal protein CcmA (bactofilin family)